MLTEQYLTLYIIHPWSWIMESNIIFQIDFFVCYPVGPLLIATIALNFWKRIWKLKWMEFNINTDNKVKTFWLQVQQHYSLLEMIIFRVSDCSSSNLSISLRLSDFLWSGEDLRYPLRTWKNLIGKNSLINMKSST